MIDFNIDEIEACCDSLIADELEYLAPVGMNDSVKVKELIARLRKAEKDAARYRWIKENGQLGVGRCGVDWELHFKGPAPDNSAKVERHIDEEIQCNK